VLLLRRVPGGNWDFLRGKLKPGETPAQAAVREVKEECGLVTPGAFTAGRFVTVSITRRFSMRLRNSSRSSMVSMRPIYG
jgi:8-oxo-dGTP pyrophosphatase MutT (NUDIX family)